jgi:hypothetical protein
LYDSRSKLEEGSAQYGVANRFFYLLVTNEVECICLNDKSKLALQNRRSRALIRVSEYSVRKLEEIKSDDRKTRNYFAYLAKAGPGALLEMGKEVANL